MPWFYYNGAKTTPIPVGGGEVVAARPHDYIEIKEITHVVRRLISRNMLVRSGIPKTKMPELKPVEEKKELVKETSKTAFSDSIIETGKTLLASVPPKKAKKLGLETKPLSKKASSKKAETKKKKVSATVPKVEKSSKKKTGKKE